MTEETDQDKDETYLYMEAGIREKHGTIPFWLKLVAVGLLIWSLYYMIQFWSD